MNSIGMTGINPFSTRPAVQFGGLEGPGPDKDRYVDDRARVTFEFGKSLTDEEVEAFRLALAELLEEDPDQITIVDKYEKSEPDDKDE